MPVSAAQQLWMYETMVLIRDYEDYLAMAYFDGKMPPNIQKGLAFDIGAGTIPGEMHLSAGQETAAVGVCAHLKEGDSVWGTHRTHHFAIAHGVELNALTAEIYGKVTGLCRGKGGHMHLFDPATKFACTGIVGGGIPHAVGAALAAKKRGKDWVAVAEFGEGASNEGAFHEALNMASLWQLPVVFVCQDNNYGISVPKSVSTSVESIAERASAYNMPGISVGEVDPEAVFEAAGQAVERARSGGGPTLIEAKVFRYYGHFQGDPEPYRPKGEVDSLREQDPIPAYAEQLKQQGVLSAEAETEIKSRVTARIQAAFEFGQVSGYPAADEAFQHVFAD
ncbi:thiamine pyrophosphate-dependent dehydrogenase E1 component subunit alpha [Pseudohalioglobus lutimaris]|uniref:Pyruvate dehydrogenase (Acetyl-transferring) E1 component subunit alpha n=1 Tax=Pseudohalioglobus lutimaris TaxID=1737061 RepID=A0A2N5X5V6_9GAMM|nr:thiamine pyrophosphate-dependent dehydrogenase E1 component subunit alpha [Pseudohalioglobus lutimaris]PLW69856.1 pyruvate dehydrogenase (acetyl-transferring) E1 component subunit alpha [Pseudohalioglobus lutimaris]